jgi:hypothetical protein
MSSLTVVALRNTVLYENWDATHHSEAECIDCPVTVGRLTTALTCQVIKSLKSNSNLNYM